MARGSHLQNRYKESEVHPMITVLDVETTFKVLADKKTDADPHTGNMLVSVGYDCEGEKNYLCFYHDSRPPTDNAKDTLQTVLDKTTLLVGHNIKFDLKWLRACGFVYTGRVHDTMICEYLINGGSKVPLSLKKCCERYALSPKKTDLTEKYLQDKISFEKIPWPIVHEYGEADVKVTKELYEAQLDNMPKRLKATLELSNEMCDLLTDMELAGIQISRDNLMAIKEEYTKEIRTLESFLSSEVKRVMGDTEINLDSSEDRSRVIFSREVIDKKRWAMIFNLGYEDRGNARRKKRPKRMTSAVLSQNLARQTRLLYKTKMESCNKCGGSGYFYAMKKDGTIGKQKRICKACRGKGVVYIRQKEIAGFKMNINSVDDITVHGFKTDKLMIDKLVSSANSQQKIFVESYSRYNAIKTYLKTFIDGIERAMDGKDKIHPQYMQCVTSTGRLSSRNPNFQNMPRGGTFPVRKVVVSRWHGGHIMEGDYSQLEFRVAGFLAKDKKVYEDVGNDVDVHAYTASILGVSRQDAKADTFKPLYGGLMGTPKQVEYYRAFKNKYQGVTKWHEDLCNEAVTEQQITLPNGRHFSFENTYRLRHGGVTNSTSIKNYPVQGFATADLLPIALVYLKNMLTINKMKTIICNTVHDSIVLDVYPSEKELAIDALKTAMLSIKSECIRRYNIKYDMPIGIEIKIGDNWLDMKGVLNI